PPSVISDLYTDVKEGRVLLDLLEVLSGQQLPREKGCNTFQCRSNIENALKFVKNKSIKLINIHVADIIEGKPSIVLGLIWTIILHFHIEELAWTLGNSYNQPSLDCSSVVDSSVSPQARKRGKVKKRWKMSAKKALLLWVKEQCSVHGSIKVADFKSSWRNGLAFLAIIHALRPDLVDMDRAKGRANKENLKEAFKIAEHELNIPRLLEPEDVDVINPDEKSIMTYVAQFLQYSRSLPVAEEDMQGKVKEALSWLTAQEKKLTKLLVDTENETYSRKFQEMLAFMELFNEEKRPFLPVLSSKRSVPELNEEQKQMKAAWNNLTSQINEWKTKLDRALPPPLDSIEVWLQEVEHLLAEGLPDLQDHCKAMGLFKEKIILFKGLMDYFDCHLVSLQSFENKDEKDMPLVPTEKLDDMKRRFGNIQSTNFSILLEYHCCLCSAILDEVTLKLNIRDIKYGTKESVELLLRDWHDFIEERGVTAQLETAFQICEDMKNKNIIGDPPDTCKLFKMVDSKISMCREYIYNVNTVLQKVLCSWATYMENIHLLKTWLDETRKGHPKKVPTEILADWNSVHGSLNEAGNFLIEVSNEQVGSDISKELKKLNTRWAKFIKRTQFVSNHSSVFLSYFCCVSSAQILIARRTLCQEQVAAAEEILQVLTRNVSTQVSLPDFETAGLQTRIKEVRERLQVSAAMNNLDLVSPKSEETLSKKEVMIHFEKSQKELETSILKAMQLISQKVSPDEHISKNEEAFSILDTRILEHFLKAAEQLKNISPAHEKLAVEERCKDVRERWEAVHREIMSCIQFIMEIEIGKFNATFSKLTKQIIKEKKLLSVGKTKGLIKEHEAFFSSEGSLRELNNCLQVLKAMCERLTAEETHPETKTLVAECEQKQEELQKCAADVYVTLLSHVGGGQASKQGTIASFPSFDTQRSNLELHLQRIKDEVESPFTDEIKDTSCLQNKLLDLQVNINHFEEYLLLFMFIYLSCRMKSLKIALEVVSPIENEFILLCDSNEQLHRKDIQQFTLTNIDLIYGELKVRKNTESCIVDQIELCKQLENLHSSTGDEFNLIDLQAAREIMLKYKRQFEEMNHKMQAREMVLKELEAFLASLRTVKLSIEHATDSSMSDKPAVQGNTSKAAVQREVSLMKEKAKCLDERLQMVDIYLEDAECGGKTCCEKLIAALSEKANKAFAHLSKQELIQENELQEIFSTRNNELLKNIQDLHDKINKIGLKDPTIPAVQQRIKSLTELEQELSCYAIEMKSIREIANKFLQIEETKGEEADEQCTVTERLWEDTKLSLEQCVRVVELLKQYQSCKNSLTNMIQKQESVLSQQTSYMGKDNLQRMIAKIEAVKEEFNDHSEDVDKINQICKNLHFQINKMRSFEEPPFQNEADIIVDRWLDINEKTENYCNNLGRALALWDKLLNLFSKTDTWANTQLRSIEEHELTEEEVTQLKSSLQVQEQSLEEFDRKVAEIEHLLHNSEPPLELQVIKSSVENKMELIRKHLPNKMRPSELNGNSAELKGDLDLAKTQIGMTESLLKALFPSDTLEIFTKLEELHQKILQQKYHVKLLQKKTGCLTPEVAELKKQLQCITDLFNTKKHVFQDHFISLLNYQCKDFNDWFSSAQLSLKDCFDPSETKQTLEEKLQKLMSFLTFEGKESDIQEVKSLLSKVKSYLPEASVNQLSNWVRDQEAELQSITSKCQKQEKKLRASLQQLIRLQEDSSGLKEWLTVQEEKLPETKNEKIKLENFYQMLIKESFDSLSQLANSLRESGFTRDETVSESSHLISRYQELQTQISEALGISQTRSMEGQNFEALAQNMSSWIKRLKESVIGLSSRQGELPLEERIHQIKEIVFLKDKGDAKMQNIRALGKILSTEGVKDPAIQQTISDLQNQWEYTVHLTTESLSHQEQIQLQSKQYMQSKEDLRLVLTELKKLQQELGFDVQAGLQEKQTQLTSYIKLLQKAEGLMFLLNELKSQGDYLWDCIEDSCFMEESRIELKYLHESLLSQLQNSVQALEGHGQERHGFQDTLAALSSTLKRLSAELCHCTDTSMEKPAAEKQQQLKLQEQAPLSQCEDTLKKILALAESVEQNTSSAEQKITKDEMETFQCKHRNLKDRLKNIKQEGENVLSNTPESKYAFADEIKMQDKADTMIKREKQVVSDIPTAVEENSRTEELEECWKLNNVTFYPANMYICVSVYKNICSLCGDSNVEMVFQKQILPEAQANAEYIGEEQKVAELKNQTAELDVVLLNEQLKEIENLYAELEKQRATALSLRQELSPNTTEINTSNLQSTEYMVFCWDRLLQELEAIKKVKQHHYHLVNDYQENLSAVQSSMKSLSTEKENIKTGAMSNTVLEKIKKCMDSVQKERDILNKLKTEQDKLSRYLTCIDKELTESQVKQLDRWWEHIEQSVQKKHYQLVSEIDEFNFLMNKAQDIQKLIEHQQHLQAGLSSPDGQKTGCPVFWTSELQAIKHNVSLLKRRTELQMKRIWSEEEKKTLENSINDLQNQLEVLEHQTPQEDVQILSSDPKKYEITRRMKENISWVKDSLFSLDEKAALFPDDIKIQIRNCKAVNSAAVDKESTIVSLADETKCISPDLNPEEVTDLSALLQELQNSYQALVLKSAQRLQQLEFQLEKRQRLIADIERVHRQLQSAETLTIPDINQTITCSELGNLHVILKELSKEIQEMEGLISSHLQESEHSHGELNIFEQLFVTDQLKCLKNRARKIQKLIQNKCQTVGKKIAVYTDFSERITSLHQELNDLWCDVLKLEREEVLSVKEEVKDKLNVLKERTLAVQSSLLQITKYKEIFDFIRLNWDTSRHDELQTLFLEIKNKLEGKIKCFDNFVIEYDRHQTLLNEIQAMTSSIKNEADILTNSPGSSIETNIISAQILCHRVQQIRHLIQEAVDQLNINEVFDVSLKEAKTQQIKRLEEDIDGLHQFFQNMIVDLQAECVNKQDFQSKLEHTLHTIKQIKSEFQQPLLVDLEMKKIQYEKMHCEAMQDRVQAEFCALKDLMGKEKEKQEEKSYFIAGTEVKLDELEDLEIQLRTDIASRVVNEAHENVKLYTKAVQRAVDLLAEYEARILSAKVDLGSLEESCQILHWKPEEFESAKADIEDLTSKLENVIKPRAKPQLKNTLSELVTKNSVLREKAETEHLHNPSYTKIKEKVCANLNELEKILGQSLSQIPKSYKEALEHLEQSKVLVSNLLSAEEDLMALRRDLRDLSMMCKGSDCTLLRIVSALWGKWLGLLEAAKEWEINCEELKQEWKFVNEEVERQAIILDNLQEELPESPKEKEKASTDALLELLEYVDCYEENMDREQLLLLLLLHRIRSILNVPESTERKADVPIRYEIHAMQERCKMLSQKAQKHKKSVQAEIQERDKINEEINAVRSSLQKASYLLRDGESQESTEKAAQLEEIQSIINQANQTIKDIMEKLRIKYSEMYTIVPADIETQLEDCKKTLQDIEEKVSTKILQSSPHYVMNKKVENINNGLQAVEKMLQHKSENIANAKEIQKTIWDVLDLWHYKLNELDSEVQDIAEQDPCHAQEWMDSLMIPLQQYQQVSQRAERRTTLLNKATSKMEEYEELLKSMQLWIETTNRLLTVEAENDSAKALSKHANALQMALEDSEQKQHLLHTIYSQLDELSVIFETENIVQQINEVNGQVTSLQQKIVEILPQIQHMADEVDAIESEVKVIGKDVAKIKTILSTEDILDFSPKEHLRHGQVILGHISPLQKTLTEIQGYEGLKLRGMRMQPLSVFKRTAQLLKELKMLEKITKEQNELLESIIKETDECEQEIEKLKQFLKNQLVTYFVAPQGEMEDIKEQIIKLCQKKEDILRSMKSSMLELHQHLQQEQPESEDELSVPLSPEETGLVGKDASERQLKKKGSLSLLPSLVEETEDSSFHSEVSIMETLGDTPSSHTNTGQCFQNKPGDSKETVGSKRPEPEKILHVCQVQVAELELWLDKAKVSLESETQTPEMQQMVEQQLADCQVMLSEIEQKVASLLEDCRDRQPEDHAGPEKEAEALSLKLKDVKCNLEKVQVMLQDKYNEEQVKSLNTMQSPVRETFEQPRPSFEKNMVYTLYFIIHVVPYFQDLPLKPTEQNNLVDFIEFYVEKMQPCIDDSTTQKLESRYKKEKLVTEHALYGFQNTILSENGAGEASLNLDKKLFELLLAISRCLSNMEEMLNTCVLSNEEAAVQQGLYETLSLELQKLHTDIRDKKDDLLKSITCADGSADVFFECFNNLQARLELTQTAAASRSKSMKAGLDQSSNYQKTDTYVLELHNYEAQIAKLRDHGERFQLPVALIHEVDKLEDVMNDIWGVLRAKYAELNSPFISESQYEGLIRGLAELVDIGREKLAQDPKQLAKSRATLQSHLQNHKGFFHKLIAHVHVMQSYSKKMAPATLQKKEKFWTELVEDVRLLEQKASQYGIRIESLLKEWTEFDEYSVPFNKELEALASAVPSVNLVEETEERLMERITLLQQTKRNIDEKHARLYQMVKEGKKLMTVVSCPELVNQIGKLEELWLSLTKKVGHELHRLQTLLKLLVSYNRDSDKLNKWLESAQQRMNFWKEQSLNVSQDLHTVRNNIDNLFLFSKEVDEKSSLKSSVISTGNQLLHVKQMDAALLRSSLAQFEQKWAELITQFPTIQEKLHQLQMEKLPSREAITEIMAWLSHVEQQKEDDEATVNLQSNTSQVKNLLQKYKEYMMEMNFKQWTVDFVNQSLLQISTCDVESKRYERTEFAEHLGEMNLQWHRLQGSLNRKIQDLEHILEIVTENENKAQTLSSWLEAQGERLKSLEKPASLISVQNTLEDCKELENQLAIKSKALDQLKQNYVALEDGAKQTSEDMAVRMDKLDEMRNSVISQVAQLKTSMQSVLQQWIIYDEAYEEVNLMIISSLYCLEQCKPSVISLEALKGQVKTLQSLQDKAEKSEESWAKLQASAANLKKYCCSSFAEIIDLKCKEAHTRWTLANEEVTDELQTAQALLLLWESYDGLYTEAALRLEQQEDQCHQLLGTHLPEDNMVEALKQKIQDVKILQQGLQTIKGSFLQVSELTDQIAQQVNAATQAVLSEKLHPLKRIAYLEKMLQMKSDEFESHMLELTAMSPDIENLNEVSFRLPLSDFTVKKLQNLNRQWAQKTATALEHCSEFEGIQSDEKKFLQKCENWIQFLEKMKEGLKVNIAGRFEKLQEQQRIYEGKMAFCINTPISVLFRTEFISKLTLLKEQWQSVIRMVQQRKKDIDGLVKQWQHFRVSQQNLTNFLTCTNNLIANKEILLQRWQTTFSLTLDTGEKLCKDSDLETNAVIQEELIQLQENWNDAQLQVEMIMKQLLGTVQTWDSCEKLIKELESRLRELEEKVKDPLPEEHEELYKTKEHVKVSLHKQEIEERLNAWIVFDEKNKELCTWLVEMESKVLQTADVSIEDAIDKLKKVNRKAAFHDCMEEINLLGENKLHLKQMGDQLIKTSNKSKVAEIDDKLNKINNRWQHLFDVFGGRGQCGWPRDHPSSCPSGWSRGPSQQLPDHTSFISRGSASTASMLNVFITTCFLSNIPRLKKLEGTFAVSQTLDKNMSTLRTWLARIEAELSKPVVYDICDDQEIQKRLAEQQDLQRDIEQHSEGVESVFNICEKLLSDSDACANETECDSIQQTTRSLDRRWRNICSMSMERRMKIEETWRLWQKFLDDYSRFEDWLKSAERTAAYPNSSEVLYTNAKEELKKFEAFQRQIHERLTQLELINKQYRRLARENRTDSASKLKQMVHEGNQRWDNLQKRVAAILRRLKYFTNQRDEFEGTRESILVWLTEMDLQLTNVEHFSESNFDDKMRQLNGFQQEITLNTNKIDQLIVFGEQLIQKSEPLDAILIEDELEELHRYCQEGIEDDKDTSENETDAEDSREMQNDPWHKKAINEVPSSQQSLCHLVSPAPAHERSGCETPVSVDSIPLEWDHTGDVGGNSSHEDEEEGTYYSALSGKSISEALTWHSPDSPACRKHQYHQAKMVRNVRSGSPETSTPYKPGYVSSRSVNTSVIERWELIQAQDLRNKLRMKQNLQQWQQLNSDLSDITAWLDKTEEELEELQKAKPATTMHTMEQRIKKLKEMLKDFDNYKALVFSVNQSSKDFQQTDSTESKELQNRVRQVNLRWEKVSHSMDNWRRSLQQTLMQCQDFHELSQKLLLGLASAESRRHNAQFTDQNADPHAILECQKELMQLEKELLEQQLQVNALQEISTYLLVESDGEDYIEANEKIHVIGKKLKQLLEQVSQDLKTSQGNDISAFLTAADDLDSGDYHPVVVKSSLQETPPILLLSCIKSSFTPAVPLPFASASGLHDPILRGRLQLHTSEQFCPLFLSHAEIYQWTSTNLESALFKWPPSNA
uniref:Spectrin repeat containing nuclear envelope protein 2 n=1 Tax=Gopherus evgoodei TaxID=1825980 RepID=A0A8C4VGV8_9SAUR